MRNLLALIGALVVGFGGVGWYLGWYKLSFTRNQDGSAQVKADVNTGKVVTDTGDGMKQIGAFLGSQAQKANDGTTQPGPAANLPGPSSTTPGTQPAPPTPPSNTLIGFDFSPGK